MHPILLKLGPLPVHSYGLMIAIGFLLAMYCVQRDAAKLGIKPEFVSNTAFWCLILGIFGTRLLHIIMFPESYSWRDPIGWIAIWRGGLVFQGALPLPFLFCWWYLKKHNIRLLFASDLTMPYIPLAHALGRVGCFLNGCCYGQRTDLPWGLRFPRVPWDFSQPATGSPVYLDHCQRFTELSMSTDHWSFPVHPTQLYSVFMLLAICIALLVLRKKCRPVEGLVLPYYLILYGIGRFLVEFVRGDHNPMVLGLISSQQLFALLSALFGVALIFCLLRWGRKPEPPTVPAQ